MALTLADILNRVNDETGFVRPSAYAASTNTSERQLVAIANRSATALRTMPFTKRRATGTIAMTAATSYTLPTDFFEYVPDTAYMEDDITPVVWPVPEDLWNLYQTGGVTPAGMLLVRQLAGSLAILNPVNGVNLKFEYLSTNTIRATGGGSYKERFTADTDEWQLDDELIIMDIRWRWKKEKGIPDWQADAQDFAVYLRGVIGREFGAQTLVPTFGEPAGEPYTNLWVA